MVSYGARPKIRQNSLIHPACVVIWTTTPSIAGQPKKKNFDSAKEISLHVASLCPKISSKTPRTLSWKVPSNSGLAYEPGPGLGSLSSLSSLSLSSLSSVQYGSWSAKPGSNTMLGLSNIFSLSRLGSISSMYFWRCRCSDLPVETCSRQFYADRDKSQFINKNREISKGRTSTIVVTNDEIPGRFPNVIVFVTKVLVNGLQ